MDVNDQRTAGDRADAERVRAVRRGSPEALGELYERHAAAVFRVAYRITGSRMEAEDVLQDVFVGLRRALGSYVEQGRFGAWLRRVAARTALMRLRRREPEASPQLDFVAGPRSARPDRTVDLLEVRRALAEMSESNRIVFLMKEVEGYAHREIAEMLGISVAASRVRLHRAWRSLERRVERTR